MSTPGPVLSLLVFEAADCLMAVPATEVRGSDPLFTKTVKGNRGQVPFSPGTSSFDLGQYFDEQPSDGPWLHWIRGTRTAWLRVRRVIDVVPFALGSLTPMPTLLSAQQRTRAFLAAGIRGHEVFLLLDPARLRAERLGEAGA